MPVLILLNGPPAAGETTLARMCVDRHPLALNLDIDLVRGQLGGWRDDPGTAGLAARAIALTAARTHLSQGHDVVIPQLLCRPGIQDEDENAASKAAPGASKANRRTNCSASGAPTSRSIPASSHSMEIGPS